MPRIPLNEYTGRDGKPLSPASVQAHLSTIRGRYGKVIKDNATRERLYSLAPADASAADKKAFVDEVLTRLKNAVDADNAPVTVIKVRDKADDSALRLTTKQANALLKQPGVDTLTGLRDTAIIALMLCTGIREMELCALDLDDLRQRFGDALALRVRKGKGAKARVIPYGELDFCLAIVDAWLTNAGIGIGAVFRGFYRDGKHVRPGRLTVRAINHIMDRYPIMIDGQQRVIHPHDCRRTYARRLYEAGTDILAIQQNLGHADHKTTQGYIGTLDAGARKPPAIYSFDLAKLSKQLV